ncbi:hypothetical protein L227DRAFT_617569 [Lentinus tigrinus ALCF2SS1-6]|uniref:Uncharacterized protein n=1 Tax=Lentinus tigrinus ALCF2SS1-6 TaxID=1328759 RepID=A0A5C2RM81_9APHY|nr:hypothetical protein L227DRAFT_617569 [Lentinus tigrinus ALCF2SS1-6]
MVRTYSHNASRFTNNVIDRTWGTLPAISQPPRFILNRKPVHYGHLLRRVVSNDEDGTLPDRIEWVIVHPDLIGHVDARIRNIPYARDLIEVYRTLAKAAPSYSVLSDFVKRVGAPRSEKDTAAIVANEGYTNIIQAAERSQHVSHDRCRYVYWPRRINRYQRPGDDGMETDDEAETEEKDSSDDGWSIPTTDPWGPPPSTDTEDTDSLPELDNLSLNTIEQVAEEVVEEPPLTATDPSPPSPPPPTTVKIDDIINDDRRPVYFRGTGEDRLGHITVDHRLLVVRTPVYSIPIDYIVNQYRETWTTATALQAHRAAIVIDEFLARRGDYVTYESRDHIWWRTTYRDAVRMTAGERVRGDLIAQADEQTLVNEAVRVMDPNDISAIAGRSVVL